MKRTFYRIAMGMTLVFSISCFAKPASLVLGLEKARHYHSKSTAKIYIHADHFKQKSNAIHYKNTVQSKTAYPVRVTRAEGLYFVTIGPISSASEVRVTANKLQAQHIKVRQAAKVKPALSVKRTIAPKQTTYHRQNPEVIYHQQVSQLRNDTYNELSPEYIPGSWIVSVGGGANFPQFQSTMSNNNGSGAPVPFNRDIYTTKSRVQSIFALSVGQRWNLEQEWFSAFSASFSYQHLFAKNVGNKVIQFSDPAFTNYAYSWQMSSDVLMALIKLNVYEYNHLSPYLLAGAGVSSNLASNYSEGPLPSVTPRTNPGFASRSNLQLAYRVGAGIDYQVDDQIILSAEYQYQDIGSLSSDNGTGSWATQNLNLGPYRANGVLFSLTYLLGQ